MQIMKPIQCHLLNLKTLTEEDIAGLEHVKTFSEGSHFVRCILKCAQCGQLYFYEWFEEIDWVAGNDPQYATWIPIPEMEAAEKLNGKAPIELLICLPQIRCDSTMKVPIWVR